MLANSYYVFNVFNVALLKGARPVDNDLQTNFAGRRTFEISRICLHSGIDCTVAYEWS